MSKNPPGPRELGLRAMREARHERNKVPYAGQPKHGSKPETRYGLKNAKKKKGKAK